MIKKIHFFLFFAHFAGLLPAQNDCANSDFEYGDFTGWVGATAQVNSSTWTPGIISKGTNANVMDGKANHTIVTAEGGYDSIAVHPATGIKEIPMLAPGGSKYSVRLGNAESSQKEKLSKTFVVTESNKGFTYQYAIILQEPKGLQPHKPQEKTKFQVRLLDSSGIVLPGPCSFYSVYSGQDSSFTVTNKNWVEYKTWTTVGIDLTPYLGQTITIEFSTSDCTVPGHFGYAYVDTKCSPLEIEVSYCPGDPDIVLNAPEGYAGYSWRDPQMTFIGNTKSIRVENPQLGNQYTVELTSVTGCKTTVITNLKFNPHPDVPSYNLEQNVFTPNGDNKNDVFLTDKFKYTRDFNLKIYNRWGMLIYETNDVSRGWDGKLTDGEIIDGVYYWIARYVSRCSEDETPVETAGFVHVFK